MSDVRYAVVVTGDGARIEHGRKLLLAVLGVVVALPLIDLGLRPLVPTYGPTALPDLRDLSNTGMGAALLVPYLAYLTYSSRFWGARAVLVLGLLLRAGALAVALTLVAQIPEAGFSGYLILGIPALCSLACAVLLLWHPSIRAYLTWVREPRNVFQRL